MSSDESKVGEAIFELLSSEYGVDVVFGIPGVHNIELYRGLHKFGIRAISPRHEQGAGFMADGWSILTGKPGVCVLISGPGLTNAITPIAQAFHDSRPMLVLASTTETSALGKNFGPLHDLPDQAEIPRSICAFSETVTDPKKIPELIARAWSVFQSARPRPVHIAIPTDILEQTVTRFVKVANKQERPVPQADLVDKAAVQLNTAMNPMIIAGGGAIDAGKELTRLAELADAPVVLTGNAKGVVPSGHPLLVGNSLTFRHVRTELENSDVVLIVGSEISDTDIYNYGQALNFTGIVIRIDIDKDQIRRRTVPVIGIVGDSATTMARIVDLLEDHSKERDGATRATVLRDRYMSKAPPQFTKWLEPVANRLPEDVIVALDSTQLGYTAHWWLPANQSRSWLAPYGLGTLGCALPMAIGAAIAAPNRTVVVIVGDGGWLFTVAEMAAAYDLQCKIVLLLWDNRGYRQIAQSFDDVEAPQMGVDVSSYDPTTIAAGFGWTTSEAQDPQQLDRLLGQAFAGNGPHFIRMRVPD